MSTTPNGPALAAAILTLRDELATMIRDHLRGADLVRPNADAVDHELEAAVTSTAEAILSRYEVSKPIVRRLDVGQITQLLGRDVATPSRPPQEGDGACVTESGRLGRPDLASLPTSWGTIIGVRKPTQDRTEVRIEWEPWGTAWVDARNVDWTSK